MKLQSLAEKYHYTCYYCRHQFKLEELSREHLTPYSRLGLPRRVGGGKRNLMGTGRIVLACKVCNLNRGNMPLNKFKN